MSECGRKEELGKEKLVQENAGERSRGKGMGCLDNL